MVQNVKKTKKTPGAEEEEHRGFFASIHLRRGGRLS
jgi:hypothetical protein